MSTKVAITTRVVFLVVGGMVADTNPTLVNLVKVVLTRYCIRDNENYIIRYLISEAMTCYCVHVEQ